MAGGEVIRVSSDDVRNYALAIGALFTVIINAYTAWNMKRLERNTNSMKDALVASTGKAARLEGHAEGLQQGHEDQIGRPPQNFRGPND